MLIPITKTTALNANGIWHSASTFRKWHHMSKYPRVIVKVAGRLFVDVDEWHKMAAENVEEQVKKNEKYN